MAIGSYNAEKEYTRKRNLFRGVEAITWLVGVATLLSGVVGVSNIMLITVRERTADIGIRRAIGAPPWHIVRAIVQESTLLTAVSGYAGVVLGVAVLELVAAIVGEDHEVLGSPHVDFRVAVAATVVLTLSGVVAGLLPAKRAVDVRPVDALRAEVG
jgi:putative ABC transport system permease protein